MSARTERQSWDGLESITPAGPGRDRTDVEVECLFSNTDQQNLVAALREARAVAGHPEQPATAIREKRRAALALQEQWDAWFGERDLLRSEIKRGKECLEQVQKELAAIRSRLDEWTAFERVCGKNPLCEYMHALTVHERLEQFLPGWLERREQRLQTVDRQMRSCAKQNGLEHLL